MPDDWVCPQCGYKMLKLWVKGQSREEIVERLRAVAAEVEAGRPTKTDDWYWILDPHPDKTAVHPDIGEL